jgi:hypothetical protein
MDNGMVTFICGQVDASLLVKDFKTWENLNWGQMLRVIVPMHEIFNDLESYI